MYDSLTEFIDMLLSLNQTNNTKGFGNFSQFINMTLFNNLNNVTQSYQNFTNFMNVANITTYKWNDLDYYRNIFQGISSVDIQYNVNLTVFNNSYCQDIYPSKTFNNFNNLTFHDFSSQFCLGSLLVLLKNNFYYFYSITFLTSI